MSEKFKVGDKVRIKRDCSGCLPGEVYTLSKYMGRELFAFVRDDSGCSCQDNWELVTVSASKKVRRKTDNIFLEYLEV